MYITGLNANFRLCDSRQLTSRPWIRSVKGCTGVSEHLSEKKIQSQVHNEDASLQNPWLTIWFFLLMFNNYSQMSINLRPAFLR